MWFSKKKISFSKVFFLLFSHTLLLLLYIMYRSTFTTATHKKITHDGILIVRILLKWVNWVSKTGICLDIHYVRYIILPPKKKEEKCVIREEGKKGQMNKDRVSEIESNVSGKYIDPKNILHYIHDIVMSPWNICVYMLRSIKSVVLKLCRIWRLSGAA